MPYWVGHSHDFSPTMLVFGRFLFFRFRVMLQFWRGATPQSCKNMAMRTFARLENHSFLSMNIEVFSSKLINDEPKSYAKPFSGVSILSFGTFAHLIRTPIRFAVQPLLYCEQIPFG